MLRARVFPSLSVALIGGALLATPRQPLSAQTRGSLNGVVVDSDSSAPLEGAKVTVSGTDLEARTDRQGNFSLTDLPTGVHSLKTDLTGYVSVVEPIYVWPAYVAHLRIRLPRTAAVLRELLVRGGPARVGYPPAEVRRDSEEVPSRTAADLLAAKLPGVQVVQGTGSVERGPIIRIRGLSSMTLSSAPAIYLDGVRTDVDNLKEIPASHVERIRVLRGPSASAVYGPDAANGVILIETRLRGDIH